MQEEIKILILESMDITRKLYGRYFENNGNFIVDTCRNSDEAAEKLSRQKYDILFSCRVTDPKSYKKIRERYDDLILDFRYFDGEIFIMDNIEILKPGTLIILYSDTVSWDGTTGFYKCGIDYLLTRNEICETTPELIKNLYTARYSRALTA